jgi:uncharacterized protein YjiS (DUF1127 family)
MRRFSALFGGLAEGFRAARFHRSLNELSDWQLREMGIGRQDLPRRAIDLARQHYAS